MKISIYDLLGLIKDGKAPKKIKIDGYTLDYIENEEYWKNKYIDKDGDYLFIGFHVNLDDEVEIIEKIKEEEIQELRIGLFANKQKVLANKINELVREVNKLKEEGK